MSFFVRDTSPGDEPEQVMSFQIKGKWPHLKLYLNDKELDTSNCVEASINITRQEIPTVILEFQVTELDVEVDPAMSGAWLEFVGTDKTVSVDKLWVPNEPA
jgi:hypothetical protein